MILRIFFQAARSLVTGTKNLANSCAESHLIVLVRCEAERSDGTFRLSRSLLPTGAVACEVISNAPNTVENRAPFASQMAVPASVGSSP